MNNIKIIMKKYVFQSFLILLLTGCTGSISLFNQYAYLQDTSLKVESLNLMDKAVDSSSIHTVEINDLIVKLDKAYEYEKSRPNNKITTEMWYKLKNPNGNLLGGFLAEWKRNGIIGETYKNAKKKQISMAFDQIIELESQKITE